ncbi:hypothetical protein JTB14_022824 [Gonioctena quinquepunctata]|nr:hypothetical protein JTB14_022824 [Gonioctena quinquepunctata]
MALVLKRLYLGYFWIFDELPDKRIDDLGLLWMSSPLQPILILAGYLYFVLKWGPEFMKDRKPFDLKNVIIMYNAIQIVLNLYIVKEAFRELFLDSTWDEWDCSVVDYSTAARATHILRICHTFLLIKIADLLDTIFFVLRKKQRQVSFLHIYHHFGMVLAIWVAVKFFGGGHGAWMGFINAFVHAVMYSYYLLSAIDDRWKQSKSFKKFITLMQMAQFFTFIIIYGRLLFKPYCGYPKIVRKHIYRKRKINETINWINRVPEGDFVLEIFGRQWSSIMFQYLRSTGAHII